jgi:hypothetical protein
MDGAEGSEHPRLGGKIAERLFGAEAGNMVLYHSRCYATRHGAAPSQLCAPDKLSMTVYPTWLYLALGRLSGEISEYKWRMGMSDLSDHEWYRRTCQMAVQWSVASLPPEMEEHVLRNFPVAPPSAKKDRPEDDLLSHSRSRCQ